MVIGHDKILKALSGYRGEIGLLLIGPDNIGKTAVAIEVSQKVLGIDRYPHPDIVLLEPTRKTDKGKPNIAVGEVRDLIGLVDNPPIEASKRAIILSSFNRATYEASNAYLKTLEEPPPNTFTIITANSTRNILPTIVSRCCTFFLSPVIDAGSAAEELEWSYDIDEEAFAYMSYWYGGRIGMLFRAAVEPAMLDRRESNLMTLISFIGSKVADRFVKSAKMADDRQESKVFVINVLEIISMVIQLKIEEEIKKDRIKYKKGVVTNERTLHGLKERLRFIATAYDLKELSELWDAFHKARAYFEHPVMTRLNLDVAFLKLK